MSDVSSCFTYIHSNVSEENTVTSVEDYEDVALLKRQRFREVTKVSKSLAFRFLSKVSGDQRCQPTIRPLSLSRYHNAQVLTGRLMTMCVPLYNS